MKNNPALRESPRSQPAGVIPAQRDASILSWLEGTNRLLERETVGNPLATEEEEEEITELIDSNDDSFDDDDDDDLDLDD
ncbi:MAG: DUF3134 domain-containing protein [Leptolyngbya sp. DLM2.Bin15]|nr:MAG: DUF3134 domain-containing protein [Leptolyngbya sp. DLM2.Bin15]